MSRLTKQQQEVIEASECNLLVSAGAGAGKTHTLVERIIYLVSRDKDPLNIDSLLVVTFTNAAAAEMRQRVGDAILSRLRKGGKNVKHLVKQARLLNKASICTLHSFCLNLIRQHFHTLELDPAFRVADELECDLLKAEVVEAVLERYYDKADNETFVQLVDSYGGQREDTPLQMLILQLHDFSSGIPWQADWLERIAKGFYDPSCRVIDDYPWIEHLKDEVMLALQKSKGNLVRALELAQKPAGPAPYIANLEDDLSMVNALLSSSKGSWAQLGDAFKSLGFSRLNQCRDKGVDQNLKDRAKSLRDEVKAELNQVLQSYFYKEPEEFLEDIRLAAPMVGMLVELVQQFSKEYQAVKRDKGLLDFADLEHYALEVLARHKEDGRVIPSEAALELRKQFAGVLVDEYQDINEVQEAILQLVSRQGSSRPNLLMVGDPKQSIYRFRLAEPYLFQKKQIDFSLEQGSKNRRVDLTKNFRSRAEVLAAVNYIFRQIMTANTGELEYTADAELVYGASYPKHPDAEERSSELILIDHEQAEEGLEEDLDTSQAEARAIGLRIKELVKGRYQVYDKKCLRYRPVEYRDIVILLRATRGWANLFLEEFRNQDIPGYAELTSGYFEAGEVRTVMSLLRVIDNPRQDIPLAALLRSPIIGLDADQFAQIRLSKEEGDFFEAVVAAAAKEDEMALRLQGFLKDLDRWRTMARRGSLSLLVWQLYRETGYFDFVGGLPGGGQRQANLRALYERAHQFESLNLRGLSRFLNFVEGFLEKGKDLGEARSMGEKENVVRIMSIHRSKGLEFPFVFVAGLGKRFNMQDLNGDVLLHKSLGIGPELVNPELRVKTPTLAKLAIRKKLQMEQLAEEMRVLYVALTRAREKLILVGSARSLKTLLDKSEGLIAYKGWRLLDGILVGARCFLDWLLPALIRHRDLECLRSFAGEEPVCDSEVYQDSSNWKCTILKKSELTMGQVGSSSPEYDKVMLSIKGMEPISCCGLEEAKDLDEALSWQYPYQAAVSQPAVASTTEVKGLYAQADAEWLGHSIRTRDTGGLGAIEYGNLLHAVLQHLDLEALRQGLSPETIRDQVASMAAEQKLPQAELGAEAVRQLMGFFTSSLGQRLLSANDIKRELVFTLAMSASRLSQDSEINLQGERVLVRGIIDLLFYEKDEAVLVDYKTDNVFGKNIEKRAKAYKGQLLIYSEAVEKILKTRVKQRYIYFLIPGQAVEVVEHL